MNELSLELDKLHERPLTLTYDLPAGALVSDDPDVRLPGAITGKVTFTRVGKDVVAHGELAAVAQGECARCLAPAETRIKAAVDELWVKRQKENAFDREEHEDDDVEVDPDLAHPLIGDRIELTEIYREIVLAEYPDRFLCEPDCKGLCPECGANLNNEKCNCVPPDAAHEESALPEWKKRLKGLHLDE